MEMSRQSQNLLTGAAAVLAAAALAPAAHAAGRNIANGGFPAPANGTAMLLNLSGGAHFILGFSAGLTFYEPTNAAAYAIAPYGIALDGVTVLPNPTTTSSSSGTTTTAPPPVTTTTSGGSGSGGSGGTTSGSGGSGPVLSQPVVVSAPVGP
jgi:hypothetical protein